MKVHSFGRIVGAAVLAVVGSLSLGGVAHASGVVYGPGVNQLEDGLSNRCMDVRAQDGFLHAGARVQGWNCTNVKEQRWTRTLVPGFSDLYNFRALRSGYCLDVPGGSTEYGITIQQWPC